ncbi:hypothetical protein [Paraburkholderia sediminicola]|uniref:hypothetical protein n=1 Tax=Paraburkholderia sediminicola TaxID=458836 RepID=UPI0038BD1D39
MIRYFACAFVVASATVLPVAAFAGAQGVARVAMLESSGPGGVPAESTPSRRNIENIAVSSGRYRSPSVINGPTYFPALRRYERQQLQDHQRLQGYGFGAGWSAKPR